jgi:hypothetical protein
MSKVNCQRLNAAKRRDPGSRPPAPGAQGSTPHTRQPTPWTRCLFWLPLLLGLFLAPPASAQSLYGPGGLFLHPTAALPEKGQLTPGFLILPQHNPTAHEDRTWLSGSLDYGLTDRIEIGFTALGVTDWGRDASYGGFFKYKLLTETADRPALAIGYTRLGFGDMNGQQAFLAARKQVAPGKRHPVWVDLGVQYTDEIDGTPKHQFMPYAGVEVGLTSRLTFIAEGRPRGNNEFGTPLALTLSYQVTKQWRLAVAWANNGLSDHPEFGVGAGFSLGARR